MSIAFLLGWPVTSNSDELETAVNAFLDDVSAQLVSEDQNDTMKSKVHEISGKGVICSMQLQPSAMVDFIIIGPPEKRMSGFGQLTLAGFNEASRYFSRLRSKVESMLQEYIAIPPAKLSGQAYAKSI